MAVSYRLRIKNGCVNCGRCSHILAGWPDNYASMGLLLGAWAADVYGELIDRVIARCPLDLIELEQVP